MSQSFGSYAQDERQLWMERITRALAELKKGPGGEREPRGELRDAERETGAGGAGK
jgi:hypothetical protein